MSLLRTEASLDDVAEAAAARGSVDAEMLVKDYWVTQVIAVLQANFAGNYIFKGGTSLTKAVRCVDRFSEDIDVLIVAEGGKGTVDKLLKRIRDRVGTDLGLTHGGGEGTTGVRRDVVYEFGTRHASAFEPTIKLEMGVRGEDLPSHLMLPIRPMLADAFDVLGRDLSVYEDLQAFEVPVLHPARTLWEKLVMLHTEVTSGTWTLQERTRIGRHYGDVGALLPRTEVQQALDTQAQRRAIDQSVRSISSKWFDEPPEVPDGGYAGSAAFNPDSDSRRELEARYDEAVDLLWGEPRPATFDEVLALVASNARILDPYPATQ